MDEYFGMGKAEFRAYKALNVREYYKDQNSMRWEHEGANPCKDPDWLYTEHKVCEAFALGFINWRIFNLALDKIETVRTGSWMFDISGAGSEKLTPKWENIIDEMVDFVSEAGSSKQETILTTPPLSPFFLSQQ